MWVFGYAPTLKISSKPARRHWAFRNLNFAYGVFTTHFVITLIFNQDSAFGDLYFDIFLIVHIQLHLHFDSKVEYKVLLIYVSTCDLPLQELDAAANCALIDSYAFKVLLKLDFAVKKPPGLCYGIEFIVGNT